MFYVGRKEFSLVKLRIHQGHKIFVGKIFAILILRKVLLLSIQENRSLRIIFPKSALNMF